ncbi:DapH/DapD/GlmU-related protein [Motilimonas cestriensis]|uniref:DapH/DapD/GlmU-related protein n=1 Tax=Motilimonas cestriensis TaxID=2742685 RepID=UPI003DA33ACB
MGEGCRIGIGCKIVGKGPYLEVPKIGNNVFIGPGSVICGPVIIEDDVVIAPNAVVTKSVPKGSIVAGVPAKIIGNISNMSYNILNNEASKEGFMPFMEQKNEIN